MARHPDESQSTGVLALDPGGTRRAIAAAVLPVVAGATPPVSHGTVADAFQVWQDNGRRGAARRRWTLLVPGDGNPSGVMPASFAGDLTPLARPDGSVRRVLAAVLPLLDGAGAHE